MSTIKIKGFSEKEVYSDVIGITITFSARDLKLKGALDEVKREVELFLCEMKKLGINLDSFELNEDRTNESSNRDNCYYVAMRKIQLTTKFDPKFLNQLIGVIRENGLNCEINTNYYCSNKEELEKELLSLAILDSKKKAEVLAEASGLSIKYPDLISDNYEDYYEGNDKYRHMNKEVWGMDFDETSIEDLLKSKKLKFSQTVYVTWVMG